MDKNDKSLVRNAVALSSDTVRNQLRQATHAAHVRLNRHPLLAGLTRAGFSLAQYRQILATYYRFFEVVEPAILDLLADAGESRFSYADRRKLPWLAQDIVALGDTCPCPKKGRTIPVPADIAELIGTLYAIEGSTLGGQVISRHLQASLGLTPAHGARFFTAYGTETENRWADVCAYLEGIASDPDQRRRSAEAALHVFNILEELLNDCLHRHS